MKLGIHIVSFDIPAPPDYGGAVDVFYKAKALAALGIDVHLHCFQYGRAQQNAMLGFCKTVTYYTRKPFYQSLFSKKPYIVHSRENEVLLENLQKDRLPILFEGVHTSGLAQDSRLSDRIKLLRTHNVEHLYYANLAKAENNGWKKYFYAFEAFKLKKYENRNLALEAIFAISNNDAHFFAERNTHVHTILPFHSVAKPHNQLGKGTYILYHGNLEVKENQLALKVLCEKVFPKIASIPIVVAGKKPDLSLIRLLARFSNVSLLANPSSEKLSDLIEQAHIHLLPTFQDTGIKLKLIHALFGGRFCLANSLMVTEPILANACIVENDLAKWPDIILATFQNEFTTEHQNVRKSLFNTFFDNQTNAQKILDLIAI